jgi:rRNA maturation RNase YbeY
MKKLMNKKEQLQYLDNIQFSSTTVRTNFNKRKYTNWCNQIANHYKHEIQSISYCIVSDDELLEINKEHLNHDYYTDIITFQLNEKNENLEADIYISLDRVKENAILHNIKPSIELRRVIAHGLLHLLGFKDKTKNDQLRMREAEEHALSLYQ